MKHITTVVLLLLLIVLTTSSFGRQAEYRIRPKIAIKSDLFEGDIPQEILCMFIETYMDTDQIIKIYFYYLRHYGQPSIYTTYYARGYDLYPHGPDYLPFLGEYIIYDPPGDPPPYLWTNYEENPDDRYKRVYYFVVTPRPYISFVDAPIAWTKTINFFTDPENWWAWNYDEYYFYLSEGLLPGFLLPIFNNFPHPQGYIYGHPPGWPDWWPGDPTDHCHVDWCFHERWPDELPTDPPAYGHGGMTLHMIIDDWDTWDEMWEAYILDRGRWVQ